VEVEPGFCCYTESEALVCLRPVVQQLRVLTEAADACAAGGTKSGAGSADPMDQILAAVVTEGRKRRN
jgi:hypothetical protein